MIKIRSFVWTLLAIGLMLVAAGCSPVRVVKTEAADNFRLAQYQTFNFYEMEASGNALAAYRQQMTFIQEEMTRALEQRGLRQVDQDPDLRINLGVVVQEEVQTRETNLLTDPPTYFGQRRYTWRSEEVEVGRYNEGTLSVDLVNNSRNELVWQGIAEAVVPKNAATLRERITKGVQKLVKRIP
ncbi:DUF4136 domain-containing protein [Pontibacter qinzhouensis]|uniref:DUF4136 domain-containing protein n=1 Tax=Pontibacter qinzhouensis TaxID=2603253 RepID=A0A5C8KAF6_9BACT|nr:DUF4136 domain-containing protein [Pontibacter qinzhouensis]TXK48721.1 DUF4136 domain-containing protein [Pontibacter qinzhouensis]